MVRFKLRNRKRGKIQKILTEFRGLKDIQAIKGATPSRTIEAIKDKHGQTKEDKTSIANVFADFYESLYFSEAGATDSHTGMEHLQEIEPVSVEELVGALKGMKRGKAKDEAGVIAEMLKDSSDSFRSSLVALFNDVLCFRKPAPAAWKRTKLTVIFKKGDPKEVANYRPIAIISIMYKLFSRILCTRLLEFIIPNQGVEQAAYRKGYSTEDHLLTVTVVVEKCREYCMPLWMALVDFTKAFDKVEHSSLFQVLERQGVPKPYCALLRHLYADQTASVHTGVASRTFSISRGVKQGDPVSSILFIAVMQQCFGELEQRWGKANARRKGLRFGLEFEHGARNLTNLRFADDVVLFAQKRADIQKMVGHLRDAASKYGLEINFDKTKVLTWDDEASPHPSVQVGENEVDVLAERDSERYLGRKLSLDSPHEVELANRIAAGWGAFHKHKAELCSKFYCFVDRLKLFNAVVTPVVLYACLVLEKRDGETAPHSLETHA